MAEKQSKEISDLENAFEDEFKAFNEDWDNRMATYKENCKEMENNLKSKQENESQTTRANLEESIPIIPKHSSGYLNFKRIQDTLVKKKEYLEAHAFQQNMLELEENQKKKWGDDRKSQIELALTQLKKRQDNEFDAFIIKVTNGFDELKKQRAVEMESLLKRYQNLKLELKNAHKLQKNRFDGKHTTGSGIFKNENTSSAKSLFTPRSTLVVRPGTASLRSRDDRDKKLNQEINF